MLGAVGLWDTRSPRGCRDFFQGGAKRGLSTADVSSAALARTIKRSTACRVGASARVGSGPLHTDGSQLEEGKGATFKAMSAHSQLAQGWRRVKQEMKGHHVGTK